MNVRDAVESDAENIAALLDAPRGVAERLLRERTVRVAERAEDENDGWTNAGALVGVVAYDADADAVHVTRLVGDSDAVERLLAEPVTFADREDLPVDVVLPESASTAARAVETKGFEEAGSGPRFVDEATTRYRRERD